METDSTLPVVFEFEWTTFVEGDYPRFYRHEGGVNDSGRAAIF